MLAGCCLLRPHRDCGLDPRRERTQNAATPPSHSAAHRTTSPWTTPSSRQPVRLQVQPRSNKVDQVSADSQQTSGPLTTARIGLARRVTALLGFLALLALAILIGPSTQCASLAPPNASRTSRRGFTTVPTVRDATRRLPPRRGRQSRAATRRRKAFWWSVHL
jgi:hypothetical protein